MEYESVQNMAQRWGVTSRAVQKWAKEGKLPGARKIGHAWIIPVDTAMPQRQDPAKTEEIAASEEEILLPSFAAKKEEKEETYHMPLLLFGGSFEAGHCLEYIDALADPDDRAMAMAEYYYFSGQAELASQASEVYLDHADPGLAMTAALYYAFSNIILDRRHRVYVGFEFVKGSVIRIMNMKGHQTLKASAVLASSIIQVQMHFPSETVAHLPSLRSVISYLPKGMKMIGAYLLAQEAYLGGDYGRSLGIAEMAMALPEIPFPISMGYLLLVTSMDLIYMKKTEQAKICFMEAWNLLRKDKLVNVIVEQHNMLQGLPESCLKRDYPENYKKIQQLSIKFNDGWRRIYNAETKMIQGDNLTLTEITVAMLFHQGWAIKEISSHIHLSERMIKHHLSVIYEKLGISNRRELGQYLTK